MSQDRYNALYVKRSITGAIQALDAIASAENFDPNDLIAGALALDQLATRQENADEAATIAAELRRLAIDITYRNSRTGTFLFNLVDLLRTIRGLVRSAEAEPPEEPPSLRRYTHGTGRGDFMTSWDVPAPYAAHAGEHGVE